MLLLRSYRARGDNAMPKSRGLIWAAALACAMLARLYAAGHDTLTIGMVQFPPDMHPDITATSIKAHISAAGSRDMTGFKRSGAVICGLRTEVPSIANGRAKIVRRVDGTWGMEVTYTLKPDLFWADGVPVTAGDSVFSFEVTKAFSPPVTIDHVEAPDARTVKVVLNRVRYDFDRSGPAPLSEHIEGPIFRAAKDPLDYGEHSEFNAIPRTPDCGWGRIGSRISRRVSRSRWSRTPIGMATNRNSRMSRCSLSRTPPRCRRTCFPAMSIWWHPAILA
jgi:peptide/nickel transport system substrate-binding protein